MKRSLDPDASQNPKRVRQEAAASPTVSYAQFKELVLRREDLGRWATSPFFEKLVRGRFVKCTLSGGRPSVLQVLGLGEPAPEPMVVEFSAGAGDGVYPGKARLGVPPPQFQAPKQPGAPATMVVRTTARLRLYDPAVGKPLGSLVPVAVVSNSGVSEEEWNALTAVGTTSAGAGLPTAEEHGKLLEDWGRIVNGQVAGKFSCVLEGGEGGSSSSSGSGSKARAWGAGGKSVASATLPLVTPSPPPPPVRLAIIVPYRDTDPRQGRTAQLARFAAYMPSFLRGGEVVPTLDFFTVLVVEQSNDGYKFNRGKLLNVGALLLATREGRKSVGLTGAPLEQGFNALCLHDVDLLPHPALGPWYATSPALRPVHIGGAWAKYSYVSYMGGILTLAPHTLTACNGYPNDFWGWGGEDDEIQRRLMRTGNFPALSPGQDLAKVPGIVVDLEDLSGGGGGGEGTQEGGASTSTSTSTSTARLRAGVPLKEGGERAWRNMLKTEALERHAERWDRNGLGDCAFKLLGVRREGVRREEEGGTSSSVIVATVDLLASNDPTAQRSLQGASVSEVEAEEERLRKVFVAAAAPATSSGSSSSSTAVKHWSEGIPKELVGYAKMSWGEDQKAAYLKLLPPLAAVQRRALMEASAALVGAHDPITLPLPPSISGSCVHRVWVIFRSWLYQDGAIPAAPSLDAGSGGGGGVLGSAGWAGDALGGAPEGIPDMLQKSLSSGPPFDAHGFGKGPLGVPQRVVGSYHYLFQHRGRRKDTTTSPPGATGDGGALAPLVSVAHAVYDEGNPEVTAWRGVRRYVDDGIPLSLFRASVLAQVDVGGGGESTTPTSNTPLPAFISPSGYPTTLLRGPLQIFIVNADTLARARGGGGGGGAGAPLYSTFHRDTQARAWLLEHLGGGVTPSSPPSPSLRISDILRQQQMQGGSGGEGGSSGSGSGSGSGSSSSSSSPTITTPVVCVDGGGIGESGEWGTSTLTLTPSYPNGSVWVSETALEKLVGVDTAVALHSAPADSRPAPFSLGGPTSTSSSSGTPPTPPPPLFAAVKHVLAPLAFHPALHSRGLPPSSSSHPHPPPPAQTPLLSIEELGRVVGEACISASRGGPLPSPLWLPPLFPRRSGFHFARAFHGTSVPAAEGIVREGGFRRSACRGLPICHQGACDDQMLGFGVYLGGKEKAESFAVKNSLYDVAQGVGLGAVVSTIVDLGHVKVAKGPCTCGMCKGKECCDHFGAFYATEGFDTLMVGGGGAAAATSVTEWAVADPLRVKVAGFDVFKASR